MESLGVVERAEAEAADGGFRMRSPNKLKLSQQANKSAVGEELPTVFSGNSAESEAFSMAGDGDVVSLGAVEDGDSKKARKKRKNKGRRGDETAGDLGDDVELPRSPLEKVGVEVFIERGRPGRREKDRGDDGDMVATAGEEAAAARGVGEGNKRKEDRVSYRENFYL